MIKSERVRNLTLQFWACCCSIVVGHCVLLFVVSVNNKNSVQPPTFGSSTAQPARAPRAHDRHTPTSQHTRGGLRTSGIPREPRGEGRAAAREAHAARQPRARRARQRRRTSSRSRSPSTRPAGRRLQRSCAARRHGVRAHRSRPAEARAPLAKHERAMKGGRRPCPRPRRTRPWAARQQAPQVKHPRPQAALAPRPEQPRQPQRPPMLHDAQQHGRRCAAACGWVGVPERRRPAAAVRRLAAARRQPHHDAVGDHEKLATPLQADVPPRKRAGRWRAAGTGESRAAPQTRPPPSASSDRRPREPGPRREASPVANDEASRK